MAELDDPQEKDELEREAEAHDLSYIRLNGNIGAMVNGAGLAMATMDVIKAAVDGSGGAAREGGVQHAVVIGAGYIGLEMAEAFLPDVLVH